MPKWGVVVPSCRPDSLKEFQRAWGKLFHKHNVEFFPVMDSEPWKGIPDWIPKRTDMIRSWGFWRAYRAGCDYILSLDDDVRPKYDILSIYEAGFDTEFPLTNYVSIGSFTNNPNEMRGFPYRGRNKEVVVQYGGWHGVPDLDAKTQISNPGTLNTRFLDICFPVPKNCAVTTCAMNFAFKREYTPIMWQLPLLDEKYNRFGDIWSGLIQKKVLDEIGKVMLINGLASVLHKRASNPIENLKKEVFGLSFNEDVWNHLNSRKVFKVGMIPVYREITDLFCTIFPPKYQVWFKHCRDQWLSLDW